MHIVHIVHSQPLTSQVNKQRLDLSPVTDWDYLSDNRT